MKKDIEVPKVKAVYVAAIIEINEQLEEVWTVHVINDQERAIEGVLVTSKGYEVENDIQYQRSTLLRHSIGDVAAKSSAVIEMIAPEVFEIYNEYWVTFFQDGQLLEKKFTFGPFTIDKNFIEPLPAIELKGIIVK
jgi:hypothetical protein